MVEGQLPPIGFFGHVRLPFEKTSSTGWDADIQLPS